MSKTGANQCVFQNKIYTFNDLFIFILKHQQKVCAIFDEDLEKD